jgi:putative LysE/RhtB family amino acid efflux pump
MIFAAMFASLGLAEAQAGTAASALAVVAGVGLGSAGWWVLFAVVVSRLRGPVFVWVNWVSGALIAGFGLWALARAASFARAAA